MRVGVAASREFLDLDDSWPLLCAALADLGARSEVAVWDDTNLDWARFDVVTPMYTWGYVTRREQFLGWVERVEAVTRLVNPAAMLAWNSDKTYLADLATVGVPIVPTLWVAPGERWEPPAEDYVVKPTVASGAMGAARYRASPRSVADAHVRRLHQAGQTVMVQPYQHRVDAVGETALVYSDGRFSHAVAKAAMLAADAGETDRLWEREVITRVEATGEQREVAGAVIAAVAGRFGPPVYARVDLVADQRGYSRLLEAELVEPSLFLGTADGAAGRLAAALARCARARG
jgi:glutathione synthase/RimK-type ligase-like ATP-grasp enzyme